jgi:hypothetical protein
LGGNKAVPDHDGPVRRRRLALACRGGFVPSPSVIYPVVPSGVGPDLWSKGSYLVDPASSHMLVSKIKPCMSKYKQLYSETANGSLNQL